MLLVKRGGSALVDCPPHLYDVAECELLAEAQLAREKREREEAMAFLKGQGYLK